MSEDKRAFNLLGAVVNLTDGYKGLSRSQQAFSDRGPTLITPVCNQRSVPFSTLETLKVALRGWTLLWQVHPAVYFDLKGSSGRSAEICHQKSFEVLGRLRG